MRRVEAPEEVAGRYHLAGRIGAGGMGEVFRARDSVLGRTVALKMLPFELAVQPGFIERFRAEAQAAARISHPGVVQVHDWGQEDDTYYMVMEYVRGKNLRHILSVVGKLQPRQSAQVAGQVLGALSAAHERGLVHRDIKPENIIVGTDGRVKVTDFGIARAFENASMTGGLLGTVAYVAPEQARGEPVDPRADIYSTGCLLFELLTGSLPFEGDAAKVLQDHLNGRVPAPSTRDPAIGPGLDRVVLRATEPNPADRYQSAQEMRSDLAMAMRSLPDAPPLAELTSEFTSEVMPESLDTVVPGIRPKKKRRWWRWVLAALLVVGLTAAVWAFSPIKVPKVVGMRSQNAVATLRDKGLSVEQSRAFSDEIEDTVISTNPAPGRRVRRGGTVRITVSAGPQLTDAPSVVGLQFPEASKLIVDSGLVVGKVDRRHDLQAKDKVLDQDPKPGRLRKGDPINLIISDGPAILEIPELRNRSASQAEALLNQAGFRSAREAVFNSGAEGTVVDQTPKAGEKLPQGTLVKMIVSRGPQPFAMPNVKGRSCGDAKSQLEGLGMRVSVQSPSGGGGSCVANRVLEQDPLADATVRNGREATLYVAG
jgi:serine/threonine protein kinase